MGDVVYLPPSERAAPPPPPPRSHRAALDVLQDLCALRDGGAPAPTTLRDALVREAAWSLYWLELCDAEHGSDA